MVSQTLSVFPSSDGRRFTRSYHAPYSYMPDRRYQLHHHQDQRIMTMTDSEVESDPSQQRKRIAVACGRCRKRKIRCSGDPGGGQPCSNCKNAGTEPCLFLRVSSSEATFRGDPNEFSYSAQDAKYTRNLVPHGLPYSPAQDLPPVASHDILSPYPRGGSAYGNYAAKPFYTGLPAYSMGYVEELSDYSMSSPSQHVLGQDMVSYPSWTSRGDYGYGGATASLVHRPAPSVAAMDSANFSLSSMAAHLPAPSIGSADRVLPAPGSRSLSYSNSQSYKAALPPAGGNDQSPIDAAAVLADMASSSSYGGGYDASGLPYNPPPMTAALQTTHPADGSRADSEAYSPETDSIFTEHEHSLRSQGSAVDLHSYTYGGAEPGGSSLRRGSSATSGGGPASASGSRGVNGLSSGGGNDNTRSKGGSTSSSGGGGGVVSSSSSSNQHGYMAIPDPGPQSNHHNHHPHHHVSLAATAAVSGATSSAAYLAEPTGTSSGHGNASICNGRVHRDTRRAAVGGRR